MKHLILALAFFGIALSLPAAAWREDFEKGDAANKDFPVGWKSEGVLPGVTASKVFVKDGVLRLESDNSSGGALIEMKGIDLKKTPILRWRWRTVTLPPDGDGRNPDKDDQAVGVYVGLPGLLVRKSVSYHYDTLAPKGIWGDTSYYLGVVKVKFTILRNQDDKVGEWFVEERNIADDLKKCYSEIPEHFAISIITNSHNTHTKAVAEVDWIELSAK